MSENIIFTSLLDMLGAEEQQRLADIRKRWAAYFGDYPKPMKEPSDNVVMNYLAACVDAIVAATIGERIDIEMQDAKESEQEQYIADVIRRSGGGAFWTGLALMGSVTGDIFVKITGGENPRLVVLDTETVSVALAPDDNQNAVKYTIAYPSSDRGRPVLIRQVIERQGGAAWTITDEIGDPRTGDWRTVSVVAWPYTFPPIFHAQNLPSPTTYWGKPDVDDNAMRLMAAINFTASNIEKILRHHAHPRTVGVGFSARDLPNNPDQMIILPSGEAKIYNVEMQSDLSSSLAYIELLTEALFNVMRVPQVVTGKMQGVGALSGVALRILYAPMVAKVEQKRYSLENMLSALIRALLVMRGFGDSDIKIYWPPGVPSDEMALRQQALIDKQLGVSADTILRNLGYDPDVEREKRAAEERAFGELALRKFETGDEGIDEGMA